MAINPFLIPRFNMDYNITDFLCAVRGILSNNRNEDFLGSLFKEKKVYFTGSGRTAIYAVLCSLNLPPSSNIGVPLYSCPSVFDAIIQAGHRPYFIDINFENYTFDPEDLERKYKEIDALIVIHTFGRPAQMDELLEITDVPVIEDCAHSLLSRYKGSITGTIGDASIFSFRSGKYISAGEGGMIVVNNWDIEENIQREIGKFSRPSFSNELKHSAFVYIKSMLYHRPWYGMFARELGMRLDEKVNISGKQGFKAEKIRKSDLAVFLHKLSIFETLVEKQRENSFLLIDELKDTNLVLPYEAEDMYCNYYLFPVLFENNNERERVSKSLRRRGIDTAKLFSATPEKARLHYGYEGDCTNTEKIADRILTIPNYYTLTESEIKKIGKEVRYLVG